MWHNDASSEVPRGVSVLETVAHWFLVAEGKVSELFRAYGICVLLDVMGFEDS